MTCAFALLAAVISAASPASPAVADAPGAAGVAVGDTTPFFTRAEPNLAAGRRALDSDDVDEALERFRRAVTATDDERAVVEYDVAQALTVRAMAAAKASAAPPAAATPGAGPEAATPPPPPDVDDALAAFERAATLARDQRLSSEARLGGGNAALVGGKLDDAIGLLRKALVADPGNERARRNLQRALTMKQQQPPPPPKDGDKGDKQDGDKQDGDKQDKQDGDKQDGDKQDADKQDADKQDGDKPGEEKAPGKAEPVKPKPTTKQEAERQLKGIRSRERPLSPFEMRGTERQAPSAGKDW